MNVGEGEGDEGEEVGVVGDRRFCKGAEEGMREGKGRRKGVAGRVSGVQIRMSGWNSMRSRRVSRLEED